MSTPATSQRTRGAKQEIDDQDGMLDTTRFNVRLCRPALERLRAEAYRRGLARVGHVSLSELINEAVLKHLPDQALRVVQRRKEEASD